MDNKQVRAHLRQGELAVQLLEGMGFRYTDSKAYAMPKWSAPDTFVNMEEAHKEIQAVLDKFKPKEVFKATCHVPSGASFRVITQNIPCWNRLAPFNENHFIGRSFIVLETQWVDNVNYRGWGVTFSFKTTMSHSEVMWLPLNCITVVQSNVDF